MIDHDYQPSFDTLQLDHIKYVNIFFVFISMIIDIVNTVKETEQKKLSYVFKALSSVSI